MCACPPAPPYTTRPLTHALHSPCSPSLSIFACTLIQHTKYICTHARIHMDTRTHNTHTCLHTGLYAPHTCTPVRARGHSAHPTCTKMYVCSHTGRQTPQAYTPIHTCTHMYSLSPDLCHWPKFGIWFLILLWLGNFLAHRFSPEEPAKTAC